LVRDCIRHDGRSVRAAGEHHVHVAYLIGVAGRNFGSSRLVVAQILCAAPLTVLALLLTGDIYYAIYSVLFVSFFFAMKFISDRLRNTLMDAVVAARDNTLLANRFDAALNNMPLGLCMFDADRRLVVINRRGTELLGVAAGETSRARRAKAVRCGVPFRHVCCCDRRPDRRGN
jgi:PAS domain-containing protein